MRGKRLPACAHCGKSLKGKAMVLFHYTAAPGGPLVGWHHDCVQHDEDMIDTAQANAGADCKEPPPRNWMPGCVPAILARGRDRVSAGVRFWRRARELPRGD